MKWLSDQALDRLSAAADAPDLSGTENEPAERLKFLLSGRARHEDAMLVNQFGRTDGQGDGTGLGRREPRTTQGLLQTRESDSSA